MHWKVFALTLCSFPSQAAFTLSSKVSYDRRTQAMNHIKCMPLDYYMCTLYPRLYAVHLLTENVRVDTWSGYFGNCVFWPGFNEGRGPSPKVGGGGSEIGWSSCSSLSPTNQWMLSLHVCI